MPAQPSTDGWVLGGRYRVLDRVGSGGMADVFRARDQLLNRDVAVKVFRSGQVPADTAHGVERQQLEVQALARLNHPNLIALYDGSVGETGHAYLVMELIDGPSLAARIGEGPLSEPAVREIGAQIADGLGYVHAQGMVHRDVKPENILLGRDRSDEDSTVRARLSDFGIVRLLGSQRLTQVNSTLGTASYLAPEQARGSDVGPPADVYALGLVLLEALTGVRAFDGPPLEAAAARLSRAPDIPSSLPAPWPGLLTAMTALDPATRPSAGQVSRALRSAAPFSEARTQALAAVAAPVLGPAADMPSVRPMAASGSTSALPLSRQPEPRRRRVNGWVVTVAVIVALLVAIALIVIISSATDTSGSGGSTTTPSPRTSTRRTSTSASTSAPVAPPATRASTSSTPTTSAPPTTTTKPAPSTTSSKPTPSSSPPTTPTPSTSQSTAAQGAQRAPTATPTPSPTGSSADTGQ